MAKRLRLFAISIVAFRMNPEYEQLEASELMIFRRREGVKASTKGPIDFQTVLCTDVATNQDAAHRHAMKTARETLFSEALGWSGHQSCEMEICPVQTFKKGFG